jgi:hypothetical protein
MVFLFPFFLCGDSAPSEFFCWFHITFRQINSCNDIIIWCFCTVNRMVNNFVCYNGWPYSINVSF